jgi:putative FmdB family regulatory protein
MPIYEYRCRDCGDRFELLQKMGDNGGGVGCPACGGAEVERQLSTFATTSAGADPEPAFGSCASGSCCGGACSTSFDN